MCLILTAWHAHPAYALVVAANRDEFYDRPAAPLAWWSDAPHVLAGRDLAQVVGHAGTWMGMTRDGRFAALTNYRAPPSGGPMPARAASWSPISWPPKTPRFPPTSTS